jgi:hypothetical protein
MDNRQSIASSRPPASVTRSQPPAASHRQPVARSRSPAVGHAQRATPSQLPAASHPQSVARSQPPAVGRPQPATRSQPPAVPHHQPSGTSRRKPGARLQAPVSRRQVPSSRQSAISSQQPAVVRPPGVGHQEFGAAGRPAVNRRGFGAPHCRSDCPTCRANKTRQVEPVAPISRNKHSGGDKPHRQRRSPSSAPAPTSRRPPTGDCQRLAASRPTAGHTTRERTAPRTAPSPEPRRADRYA